MTIFAEIDDDDTADRIEEMLPDFALDKVRQIETNSAERSSQYSVLSAKIAKLGEQIGEWRSLISRTERDWEYGGQAKTGQAVAQIAKWNRRIAKADDEIKKLSDQRTFEPTLSPHLLLEALRELPPGTALVDARVQIKPGKSENIKDLIAASRNTIIRLTSNRGAVRNALLPKDVALHRAITDIQQAAAAPDFSPNAKLVRPTINLRPRQGRTGWPTFSLETGTRVVEIEDAAAIVKFAMKDALIAAATEAISKLYEGNPLVIPEGEREARIAEIDAEILAESRREEALIEIAESKDLKVLRRPNAPPFAVLGVAVGEAPAKAAEDFDFG